MPTQGTWVQSLIWEDPTCHGAAKPVRHSYSACAVESGDISTEACAPKLHAPKQQKLLTSHLFPHITPREKAVLQCRPSKVKNK